MGKLKQFYIDTTLDLSNRIEQEINHGETQTNAQNKPSKASEAKAKAHCLEEEAEAHKT